MNKKNFCKISKYKISKVYEAGQNQVKDVRKKQVFYSKEERWEEVSRKEVQLTSGIRVIMLLCHFFIVLSLSLTIFPSFFRFQLPSGSGNCRHKVDTDSR